MSDLFLESELSTCFLSFCGYLLKGEKFTGNVPNLCRKVSITPHIFLFTA